jgi:3'-phosphoadenosine 5'-phosphosulfate sulfotransferase (PAPS reductase)/FAD synthetase
MSGGVLHPDRTRRVTALVDDAYRLLDTAIEEHVTGVGKRVAATAVLFSGGNDSTVLAHLMRGKATHAVHANTTIGIEQTREFVRQTCAGWGLPLLERTAPNETDHYASLVLSHGFPGPAHHFKMYQRLKERALRQVVRELKDGDRNARVVFLAGRRRDESKRREFIPATERVGATVWVSPLVEWTATDLNTYRAMHTACPRNSVSDLIHMSGECLCGSFAKPGERAELTYWFPEAMGPIAVLEQQLVGRTDIPPERRVWGWCAEAAPPMDGQLEFDVGPLCSSCTLA